MMKEVDLSGKKILVTGGAGFIGSNICEALLDKKSIVVCLDNLSTGKIENISEFLDNPNFNFIQGDIRSVKDCDLACEGVEYILHQAALGSVSRSIKTPIETNSVNIDGFLNMLNSAKKNKIKRIVYASSSSVYGDSVVMPKIENEIGEPLSPYAVTKQVNEMYAQVFAETYNMEIVGLRYFNVFGKKQSPDGEYAAVIPKFVHLLMNGESPTINGDGQNSRDFTYVDNVVEANILAMCSSIEKNVKQVFNIAFGEKKTLNELFHLLKSYLSKYDKNIESVSAIYGEKRIGDIPHSLADINKARKKLNYNPEYSLAEGLKSTIDWYWSHL